MLTRDEFYREWIRALRSGEYVQGRGALRKDDSFCCLGVVCDIAVTHGRGEWSPADPGIYCEPAGDPSRTTLPWGLMRFLELEDGWGVCTGGLASVNDSAVEPWTFSEIADVIELYACSIGVAL